MVAWITPQSGARILLLDPEHLVATHRTTLPLPDTERRTDRHRYVSTRSAPIGADALPLPWACQMLVGVGASGAGRSLEVGLDTFSWNASTSAKFLEFLAAVASRIAL